MKQMDFQKDIFLIIIFHIHCYDALQRFSYFVASIPKTSAIFPIFTISRVLNGRSTPFFSCLHPMDKSSTHSCLFCQGYARIALFLSIISYFLSDFANLYGKSCRIYILCIFRPRIFFLEKQEVYFQAQNFCKFLHYRVVQYFILPPENPADCSARMNAAGSKFQKLLC